MRCGLLGAMARLACVTPSSGRPLVNCRQCVPPSVDLKMPPFVPLHAEFSQGPCRPSHRQAYTMLGLDGSSSTSEPPVFSSLWRTFSNDRPPSVDRTVPRSSLGP